MQDRCYDLIGVTKTKPTKAAQAAEDRYMLHTAAPGCIIVEAQAVQHQHCDLRLVHLSWPVTDRLSGAMQTHGLCVQCKRWGGRGSREA
jgi:hypothetical protein